MLTNHETETVVARTFSARPGTSNAISTHYVQVTSIRLSDRVVDELDAAEARQALDSDERRFSEEEVRAGLGL